MENIKFKKKLQKLELNKKDFVVTSNRPVGKMNEKAEEVFTLEFGFKKLKKQKLIEENIKKLKE